MRDIDYNFCKENSLFKFEDYKKFMDSNFTSSDEILSLQSVIKDFLMSYTNYNYLKDDEFDTYAFFYEEYLSILKCDLQSEQSNKELKNT